MSDPRRRILFNPFYVLGVPVEATRAEVEREGQKLLGMLALGLSQAATYDTPLGPAPRTPEAVREAMAELRDPERRLMHELWARVPASTSAGASVASPADLESGAEPTGEPWPEALAVLGRQRRSG
jgi:hypothetical protein